jgi:hypothetical protein
LKTPTRNLSVSPLKVMQLRSPGVNQPGPIWGFPPTRKPDPTVIVSGLDIDSLREELEGR